MIGLSSSYFAFHGNGIYDSVKAVFEMGFDTVELGAGHLPEQNVWETVKRIKQDFPGKGFTIHSLFPPLQERFWFNASLGLTKENRAVVEGLFRAASLVEASAVSIHTGFANNVGWGISKEGFNYPVSLEPIPSEKAWEKQFELLALAEKLSRETGSLFCIENIGSSTVQPLVVLPKDFERVFQAFPAIRLLLDVGHAMYEGKLQQFSTRFSSRIGQLHMHTSQPKETAGRLDDHSPIESEKQLSQLAGIKNLKEIPIIFEHGTNVSRGQLLKEKEIVESFIGKL